MKTNKIQKAVFILSLIILIIGVIEMSSLVVIKIRPNIIVKRYKEIESFEPGNLFFKPHHYFALEINPGQKINGQTVNNSYGLRGEDFPLEKAPGEYRIVCMGGSTTQYMDVRILEKTLQDYYPNKKIRVINGGVGTYTTAEILISYLFKISYLTPDLIIIYEGINDVFPQAYYRECHPDYREYRKIWCNIYKVPPLWFYKISCYSNFLNIVYSKLFPSDIWNYSLNPRELSDKDAVVNVSKESFGQYFRNNLQSLIFIANAEKKDVLLITFIYSGMAPLPWKIGIDKHNEILRDLASKNGVYLFDLVKCYKEQPLDKMVFSDEIHFTEMGDKWRIKKIAEFIKEKKIIK